MNDDSDALLGCFYLIGIIAILWVVTHFIIKFW